MFETEELNNSPMERRLILQVPWVLEPYRLVSLVIFNLNKRTLYPIEAKVQSNDRKKWKNGMLFQKFYEETFRFGEIYDYNNEISNS
jgi:hypothetical protein